MAAAVELLRLCKAPTPTETEFCGHSVSLVSSFPPLVTGPCLLVFGGFDGSTHHQLFAFDCGMHVTCFLAR